jgi:hypothetical protein
MNYTSLAQMPFSQIPADDGNSSCGDASIQAGRFVLEAPAVGAGKVLSLYVPSDFRSSSYTVSAQISFLHRTWVLFCACIRAPVISRVLILVNRYTQQPCALGSLPGWTCHGWNRTRIRAATA